MWSRGSPAGIICSLRPVFQITQHSSTIRWIPTGSTQYPMCARCLVVRSTWVQIPRTLLCKLSISCPASFCSPCDILQRKALRLFTRSLQCQSGVKVQSQDRTAWLRQCLSTNSIVILVAFSWARRRTPPALSNRILRFAVSLPAMIAGTGTMQWKSLFFILRAKIIAHPAEEFLHCPLFHPK